MVATVSVRVYTGAGPTESAAVTGIDLINADNDTNTTANRQAYPIVVGTNSYEKWVALKIDTPPSNNIINVKIWGDGTVHQSTTLRFTTAYSTYSQGTTALSSIANTTFTNFTAGNKATWDSRTFYATGTGSVTRYSVFQLQVGSDAGPGTWTQETISYSYDES